ncbi:homeobox-like domain superfamily [Holotrichia oblita]|uniref:Homeobox-like domain superfamily n=1 Tax=Holotrichia oblita TaxID=644536 RepID=A0ACB9SZR1_HOLOL|nr:homeobox-like domain superfamily [Holotrichia oblita]
MGLKLVLNPSKKEKGLNNIIQKRRTHDFKRTWRTLEGSLELTKKPDWFLRCPQVRSQRLSEDIMNNTLRLIQNGYSSTEVARIYNVSHSVFNRVAIRFRRSGSVKFTHGGGRRRCTTPAQNEYLRLQVK